MSIPVNVQRAIDNGYEFRFGDYISQAFKIVQKNMGQFIVGTLVLFVIMFGVSMVSGVIGTALAFLGGVAGIIMNQIISQATSAAVTGPLTAGMFNVAQKTDLDKATEFGDFFAGFSKWVPLFTTTIMSSIVILVSAIPGIYLMYQGGLDFTALSSPRAAEALEDVDFGNVMLGGLVALIPAMYLGVSYAFAPALTWFYNISGWDALEASRKLVAKNFLAVLGFMIVIGFILAGGIILLCVGILFTFPVYTTAMYAAFADVVKLNTSTSDPMDEIIDHFSPKG